MNEPMCEAPGCDAPAGKVVDGHNFCSLPSHRTTDVEIPITLCAVPDCGCPAVPNERFCLHHQPFASRLAA